MKGMHAMQSARQRRADRFCRHVRAEYERQRMNDTQRSRHLRLAGRRPRETTRMLLVLAVAAAAVVTVALWRPWL